MSGKDKADDKGQGGGKGDDKKIDLTIVVSGDEVKIKAKLDDTLGDVAQKALDKSENIGRPLTDWILRNENGEVLDLNRTVGSYGLKDGDLLSLTLEAGVAG
jgi:hypothetical protein